VKKIVCWWSGGITSAVACKLAIDLFGIDSCQIIFIDTHNEAPDTYRFKDDCEKWYGKEILSVWNPKYKTIQEVWYKFKSLNVANGAICSSELKRAVRLQYEKDNPDIVHQIFGFDIMESKRALAMKLNYPGSNPIFPLLLHGMSKKHCIQYAFDNGVEPPSAYFTFNNNNCLGTGCVQGGIVYWQQMKIEIPENFYKMAEVEHELTNLAGKPVTMLKDQNKKDPGLVFLLPHPDYPFVKDLSMMKGKFPEPLMECNGFCGTNDLLLAS